jgi:hypothetical protein
VLDVTRSQPLAAWLRLLDLAGSGAFQTAAKVCLHLATHTHFGTTGGSLPESTRSIPCRSEPHPHRWQRKRQSQSEPVLRRPASRHHADPTNKQERRRGRGLVAFQPVDKRRAHCDGASRDTLPLLQPGATFWCQHFGRLFLVERHFFSRKNLLPAAIGSLEKEGPRSLLPGLRPI